MAQQAPRQIISKNLVRNDGFFFMPLPPGSQITVQYLELLDSEPWVLNYLDLLENLGSIAIKHNSDSP
ncbi:MAG TPA: hypothetical protein PK509_04575 [Catalimonadaceae bacterium]|nr:hypothetical protein [Catalimonadaceae bacterium]